MKKINIIMLAFRNVLYRKRTTIQIIISTLIAFFVINSLFVYKKMMINSIDDMSQFMSSSYNIMYYIDSEEIKDFEKYIDAIKEISDIKKYSFFNSEYQYKDCELEIDDISYMCINEVSNISKVDILDIQIYDYKYSLISENEYKEADYRNLNIFFDGKNEDKEEVIFLPEEIIKMYGIEYKNNSLVGKKIKVKIKGQVIGNYIVGGVLKDDFYEIKSRQNNICMMTNEISDKKEDKVYELYFDEFENISLIKEMIDKKFDLEGNVSKQYNQIEYLHNQVLLLDKVYIVIGITLFTAIMFNSVRVTMYSFYRKSRFLGIISANGYSKSEIFMVGLVENIICTFIGLVIAMVSSYYFMSYITVYISEMLGTRLILNLSVFFCGSIGSIIISLFIVLTTMLGMYVTTIRKRIIELLF